MTATFQELICLLGYLSLIDFDPKIKNKNNLFMPCDVYNKKEKYMYGYMLIKYG